MLKTCKNGIFELTGYSFTSSFLIGEFKTFSLPKNLSGPRKKMLVDEVEISVTILQFIFGISFDDCSLYL